MTNEQHIENLKKLKSFHNGSYGVDIDRAIKALEQEQKKTGHWMDKFAGVYRCSCCRETIEIDIEIDHPNGITFNYCPNCGACMKDCRTLDEFIEDSKKSEG